MSNPDQPRTPAPPPPRPFCTVDDIKGLRIQARELSDADCEHLCLAFNSLAVAALGVARTFGALADIMRTTLASLGNLDPEARAQLAAWLGEGVPITDLVHVNVEILPPLGGEEEEEDGLEEDGLEHCYQSGVHNHHNAHCDGAEECNCPCQMCTQDPGLQLGDQSDIHEPGCFAYNGKPCTCADILAVTCEVCGKGECECECTGDPITGEREDG